MSWRQLVTRKRAARSRCQRETLAADSVGVSPADKSNERNVCMHQDIHRTVRHPCSAGVAAPGTSSACRKCRSRACHSRTALLLRRACRSICAIHDARGEAASSLFAPLSSASLASCMRASKAATEVATEVATVTGIVSLSTNAALLPRTASAWTATTETTVARGN